MRPNRPRQRRRCRRFLVLVADPQAATNIKVLQGRRGQLADVLNQGQHFPHRRHERSGRGDLRTDMHLDPANLDASHPPGLAVDRRGMLNRDPEFALVLAGRDVPMGVRINPRIDADRDGRFLLQTPRHQIDGFQLRLAFHVKRVDPLLNRVADFVFGLADARKHTPPGVAPRSQHPVQVAGADQVKPGPLAGQQPDHRQVAVGLDGRAHHVIHAVKRAGVGSVLAGDIPSTVNVKRGAVAGDQPPQRHLFAM